MPYYREQLLSQWPSTVFEVGRMQPKIDPDLQPVMKRGEIGFYAPNVKKLRPNHIVYPQLRSEGIKPLVPPKFLSEKARESTHEDDKGFKETVNSLREVQLDNVLRKDVPHIYQNVEIKYSRFGVDDFDFE
jgi:PAB-dependent poly(A)-specific ribonuclease subunit 2